MKKTIYFILGTTFLFWNFVLWSYFLATWPAPIVDLSLSPKAKESYFLTHTKHGIHHAILKGSDYERGFLYGQFTKDLLIKQEKILVTEFRKVFSNPLLRRIFELTAIHWFRGIDNYFPDFAKKEMYGISKSAPDFANYLASPYMRQIAYHGIHEVGQMMIDQGYGNFACTQLAFRNKDSWIIGRNFDFEVHPIFDQEKVLKWVFPNVGYKFVSVVWAGMVGAVTAINEHGVYIALNAAASDHWARLGTPSTIVLLKAIQNSNTAREAVEIIKTEQMFNTDIFLVSDRTELYRIEKSAEKSVVIAHQENTAISNHLIAPEWKNDQRNRNRIENFSSNLRLQRAKVLVKKNINNFTEDLEKYNYVLESLRDRKLVTGENLYPGNRGAIDSLIAAHSVIYDHKKNILFVSKGPHLQGAFLGFDLESSFKQEKPVAVFDLNAEEVEQAFDYNALKKSEKQWLSQFHLECTDLIKEPLNASEHHLFYMVLGKKLECQGKREQARIAWNKSLELHPPLKADQIYLKGKLENL